jgi:RHS repeat-associated protein
MPSCRHPSETGLYSESPGEPCAEALAREVICGARFPEPVVMVHWTAAGDVAAGSEEVLHYVRDALGSVVGLTDAGEPDATPEPVPAKLVERYDYDPYGKTYIAHWDPAAGSGSGDWVRHEADEPSAFGNPFMWTGQRHDVAIGLYHFPFRTYSPRLGRWLQRDPLGYVDGVNMYAYAGSSPTNLVDPLGFTSLLPEAPGSGYDPMLGPFGGDAAQEELKPWSYPRPGPLTPRLRPGLYGGPRYPNNPNAPTNGCSSPVGNAPSGVDFSPACNEHDRCYGTLGKSKLVCDREFFNDMVRICLAEANSYNLTTCVWWAFIYYAAVAEYGQPNYDDAQRAARAGYVTMAPAGAGAPC